MNRPDIAMFTCRHFITYSGMQLPFRLVDEIDDAHLGHRNTFTRAWFDDWGALIGFDKIVYGEVELQHRYTYHGNGALAVAEVAMLDEGPVCACFNESGAAVTESFDA